MTNFERIKGMNEEELAEFLYEVQNEYFGTTINGWSIWLGYVIDEQETEE